MQEAVAHQFGKKLNYQWHLWLIIIKITAAKASDLHEFLHHKILDKYLHIYQYHQPLEDIFWLIPRSIDQSLLKLYVNQVFSKDSLDTTKPSIQSAYVALYSSLSGRQVIGMVKKIGK